ncbi:MAG: hypothetical protein GY868_20645 [Deltaproteobacteria bacterium]|nr:hypothetical protein [Deltaproteobacteria bacterium]
MHMVFFNLLFFSESSSKQHWSGDFFGTLLLYLLLFFAAGMCIYFLQRLLKKPKSIKIADIIRDAADIESILLKAIDQKQRLRVRMNERKRTFLSMLLKTSRSHILIDGLFPEEGNDLIDDADFITIDFTMRESVTDILQIPYSFKSAYIRQERHKGYPALRINFPESIQRVQRRQYLRISPPVNAPLFVTFELDNKSHTEKIANISGGGVGFYTNHSRATLCPGLRLTTVTIDLPDYIAFTCPASIHINTQIEQPVIIDSKPYYFFCGVEFEGIKEETRETIIRYVVEKERAELKRINREFT